MKPSPGAPSFATTKRAPIDCHTPQTLVSTASHVPYAYAMTHPAGGVASCRTDYRIARSTTRQSAQTTWPYAGSLEPGNEERENTRKSRL
eukprot:3907892-Rhodomonas_salina.1